jgi:hypothetical protein
VKGGPETEAVGAGGTVTLYNLFLAIEVAIDAKPLVRVEVFTRGEEVWVSCAANLDGVGKPELPE